MILRLNENELLMIVFFSFFADAQSYARRAGVAGVRA